MILVIDAGTTSIRGILYNSSGINIFNNQIPTTPKYLNNNEVEQEPLTWKNTLFSILKSIAGYLTENNLSLDAISITSFRSPVFPADSDNQPLMPAIMWQDRRTEGLCRELSEYNHEVIKITGLPVSPVFSAIKMLWIKNNRPEIYKKTTKMFGIFDYIIFQLTGEFITDQSIASRSNIFNITAKQWEPSLLKMFSVEQKHLPGVVPPGSICGKLSETTAKLTGLKSGIPVVAAGGDQQCAALGMGLNSNRKATINTGTGAYILKISDDPHTSLQDGIFCNISAVPDKYIIETSLLTAGTIYRWFNSNFSKSSISTGDESFSEINKYAASSPPGSNGLISLPFFSSRATDTPGTGAFLNLDLSNTKGDMARAVLEGIAIAMNIKLQKMEELSGTIKEIISSGGLTKFNIYNQIQADIYNKPVVTTDDSESTSFGAWISAVTAIGGLEEKEIYKLIEKRQSSIFRPDPGNSDVYRQVKKHWSYYLSRLNTKE